MLNTAQMGLLFLFHPKEALDIIKRERGKFRLLNVLLPIILLALVNYTYVFYVSFVLGTKTPSQTNILLDLAIALLPVFTWVVASYATTAVVVGECSFTELLTGSAFCLTPIIVIKPILGLLSHVLTVNETDVFRGLTALMYVWVVILLLLTLQRLNDYSTAKTFIITLIAILAMLIIWAVVLLLFALFAQVVSFIKELFREFQLKY